MATVPRPLDHLVLPVADLGVAEARYRALGFAVAPRGRHPFGTENACVYFSNDTFLEPLAVADAALAAQAVREGNLFVGHDATYRIRAAAEGLSALVLGTEHAEADHQQFRSEGLSGGNMLRFARPFQGADGAMGEATFLLAFAKDLRAPDALFFTCERVGVPTVDRTPLTRHPNGVERIKRVLLVAPEPQLFQALLETLVGEGSATHVDDALEVQTANGRVTILNPGEAARQIGGRAWDTFDPTLQFVAIEFETFDLATTVDVLAANGIGCPRTGGAICVAPAPGQGVPFLFSGPSE